MKRSLLALAFLLVATPAFAVCPATLQLKDNAGATPTAKYTDDGSGNCMANIAVQDGADATQGAKADAVASTDTGTFSLTALIKRLNQSITALIAAVQAAIPAGTNRIGYTSDDPCSQLTKLGAPISLTSSGQVITGTASNKIYICAFDLMGTTAGSAALVEGTGTVCATNIFGLAGGTTAATGWPLLAGAGLTKGSGNGTVISPSADANATAANVCILISGTGQTSGHISYVKAP